MTKTKRERKAAPPRLVASPEDFCLITLAARVTRRTQAEFIEKHFRRGVRRLLVKKGVDPDKALAEYHAKAE